ncbi:MAG: gamma-glutamylcyclotransferase [Marinibacterium profundimaris]
MPPRSSTRAISLTESHVARVYREVPDPGPSDTHTPMTDDDKAELAQRLLEENAGRPFWVFAYGSLIWKPAFEYDESRACILHGWHRSFCLHMQGWRATPEEPGLMLALDKGGACKGVAFKMPEDDQLSRMIRLIEREGAFREMIPWIRWVTLRANGESFRGLVFYCTPPADRRHDGEGRLVRLPLDDQVHRLARAVGHAGSCAEYLFNTVSHLEELGIHDSYMWKLQALVADEIDAVHGPEPRAAAE